MYLPTKLSRIIIIFIFRINAYKHMVRTLNMQSPAVMQHLHTPYSINNTHIYNKSTLASDRSYLPKVSNISHPSYHMERSQQYRSQHMKQASNPYTKGDLSKRTISFNTVTGRKLLKQASFVNPRMLKGYTKQINKNYCGPASLALLINALNVAYRIKFLEIQGNEAAEKKFVSTGRFNVNENDIVNLEDVKDYLLSTNINAKGLNLRQLANVATILGFNVDIYYACGSDICETDQMKRNVKHLESDTFLFTNTSQFRKFAMDYISKPVTGLIVNYDWTFGYDAWSGHFSPLAAYDAVTDRLLVMDVSPKHPPLWVTASLLFEGMSSIDRDSNLPRGLLRIYERV